MTFRIGRWSLAIAAVALVGCGADSVNVTANTGPGPEATEDDAALGAVPAPPDMAEGCGAERERDVAPDADLPDSPDAAIKAWQSQAQDVARKIEQGAPEASSRHAALDVALADQSDRLSEERSDVPGTRYWTARDADGAVLVEVTATEYPSGWFISRVRWVGPASACEVAGLPSADAPQP